MRQPLSFILAALLLAIPSFSFAVDVQFPEEELARESVYPVFDNPTAVKRRNVTLENRLELALYGGWSLNDALSDPMTGGAMATYHFSEFHAFQVQGGIYSSNKSQYVPGIENEFVETSGGQRANLSYIPQPKYLVMGNYQFSPYYGKISLTKQGVMNLSIFATLGAGTIAIGDSNYLAFGLGLGQKLYLSSNWGIRTDLKMLFHEAPNALSKPVFPGETPPNSYYEKHHVTNGLLTISAFYLL